MTQGYNRYNIYYDRGTVIQPGAPPPESTDIVIHKLSLLPPAVPGANGTGEELEELDDAQLTENHVPVAGVTYLLYHWDTDRWTLIDTAETNSRGIAEFLEIPEGEYFVREEPDERLTGVTADIYLTLPFAFGNGYLNPVHIYPKTGPLPSPSPEPTVPPMELPETGGGGTAAFTAVGAGIALLAAVTLLARRKRDAGDS